MEQWNEIRRKVFVEGVSKRSICRDYGVGWWTLEKTLANLEPPGYRARSQQTQPKLGPLTGVIDEILATDADPTSPRRRRPS